MTPIDWAGHQFGWIGENGKPVVLAPWQRAVMAQYWLLRLLIETLLIATVKKAGKTFLNSLLLCFRWVTMPGLHFAIGNDADQSAELQISMIAAMVRRHPILSKYTTITRSELVFRPTGSRIVSLPMDYAGGAGANFLTSSWTELWAFTHEASERLHEELTPIPLVPSLRIIDSYAGYAGESLLLQRYWDRALAGERVNDEWPIYKVGKMLAYIHQGEDAQERCWRGTPEERKAYYDEQRATLRDGTNNRLHLNLWASSESRFIPIEWYDLAATGQPLVADKELPVVMGVDAGLKRDSAAVVAVTYDREQGRARQVAHRIFTPRKNEPLDIEDTLEDAILEFASRFRVRECRYDPWQFQRSAQGLSKRSVKMVEYPQTVPNLTSMSNNLYELLKGGNFITYPDSEVRLAFERAIAVEGARGMKIAKEKAGHKIDVVVALAMAAQGAVELLGTKAAPATVTTIPGWGGAPTTFFRTRGLNTRGGYWTKPHPEGVTWRNCRHRNAGCKACVEELKADPEQAWIFEKWPEL